MLIVFDGWATGEETYEEYFGWKDNSGKPILETSLKRERYIDYSALVADSVFNVTTIRINSF